MRRRRWLPYVCVVALLLLLALVPGCFRPGAAREGKGWPLRVVVSFAPLYSFVKSVGGGHVSVFSLATATGPHDYGPPAREEAEVRHADLLVALGLGLEVEDYPKWLRRISGKDRLRLVELGEALPPALLRKDDPHVWLGVPQAVKLVEKVRDELKRADPAHAADYDRNAREYARELEALGRFGKDALAGKKDRRVITPHDYLRYFADSFGLEVVGVIQAAQGKGATGDRIKKLVGECLKEKVRYIAVEPQDPQPSSANLLKVLNRKDPTFRAKLITIDPLETADPKELDAGWYVRKMRENLKTLADELD